MNKKVLLSISLLTAAVMGASPVTSYAGEIRVVQIQPGGECQIISGGEEECLQQILSEIGSVVTNIGNYCPAITIPGTTTPDTTIPDTETSNTETPAPDTTTPDTEIPDTETSDTDPPAPDTTIPDTTIPDTTIPDTTISDDETPGTETPAPDTTTPDTTTPDTGASDTPDTEKPGNPETEEGNMDEAVYDYAQQILNLVNTRRAEAGLAALELKADITGAANVRAKEIKQSFSHTRPNGGSFSSVLSESGISFRGSGENIAYGQQTPEQVMEAWMNSASHRANILNENFKNIGVGHYQDEKGVNYWVQLFTY